MDASLAYSAGESSSTVGPLNPSSAGAVPGGVGHRLHKPGVAGSSPAAATLSHNEPITSYHSDREWWSKSQLWTLHSQGPAAFHGRYLSGTPQPYGDSEALKKGTYVHEWAEVGDEEWWSRVVIIPEDALGSGGRRTKATDQFEADTLAKRPDAILLKADEAKEYRDQFAAILANAQFRELTEATIAREISIRWLDHSGLKLKCRPDAITDDCIWDIKTTREAKPLDSFWKSVVDFGYAYQQCLYLSGLEAAGLPIKKFIFLVTSTVPPYRCHAVTLPPRLVAKAEKQVRQTIAELQARIELDHWLPEDSGQVAELYVPERYMEERDVAGSALRWVQ